MSESGGIPAKFVGADGATSFAQLSLNLLRESTLVFGWAAFGSSKERGSRKVLYVLHSYDTVPCTHPVSQ